MGQWISLLTQEDQVFSGYLALPPAGIGPGLLLVQEIWGVNEHIQALAEQYAADGFVVLAPDVFWRQQQRVSLGYDEQGTQAAYALYNALDFEQAGKDLSLAFEQLLGRAEVSGKSGVLGYCMGGRLALSLASHPALGAGVSYYGSGIGPQAQALERLSAPYLFHFAGEDHLIPVEQALQIMAVLGSKGVVDHYGYAGAGHGFNCPQRGAYSVADALLAKARTLKLLHDRLMR